VLLLVLMFLMGILRPGIIGLLSLLRAMRQVIRAIVEVLLFQAHAVFYLATLSATQHIPAHQQDAPSIQDALGAIIMFIQMFQIHAPAAAHAQAMRAAHQL
jgi:hypothetical protein